ncbi:YgcG family protein [uncultured Alistipes sp.]|uniref:TPM domain-containing protein n=1 Tax=uncultured Alistipes sp. TaxID=538949 RepID=UPI002637C730|nr:TPM domain-containing protein [uncultured Alistipes sp.]
MKNFFLLFLGICLSFPLISWAGRPYRVEQIPNVQLADRYRFTSNPDGVLSSGAVAEIDSICYVLRHKALAQVAVVAVEQIEGDDLFTFAHTLFSQWGVGRQDSDNGLGILLVVGRHEVRFVTGYGLEGVLPDALCSRIINRYMLPYFREGNYSAGMVVGVQAVASVLNGSELDLGGNDDYRGEDMPGWMIWMIILLCIGLPLGVAMWRSYRESRCPHCHKRHGLVQESCHLEARTDTSNIFLRTYRCRYCGAVVTRRTRRYRDDNHGRRGGGGMWIGGFGGGRGFGGGSFGGGFGGGSFGGGGAGGRW